MKKRLIVKRDIKRAYSQDLQESKIDLNQDLEKPDIDKVPKEIFEILGEVVSFIQITNQLEGVKNENQ